MACAKPINQGKEIGAQSRGPREASVEFTPSQCSTLLTCRGSIHYNGRRRSYIQAKSRRGRDISNQFSYQIRRSARAKRARLLVTPYKVEVVAPLLMKESAVRAFVHRNRAWIEKTRSKMSKRLGSVLPLSPEKFDDGAEIPFKGARWPLSVRDASVRKPSVSFADAFVVSIPSSIAEHQREEEVRKALVDWLRAQALLQAQTLSARHASVFGLFPRSVRIREQRTRWGSCGIRNDINLNWRLIFAPMSVLEYVVVHELCHIRHRNHSADFWTLVGAHLPHYRRERQWLREHGARLMSDF
ncbi:MAG: SprT family zinc-dependent metalloprotease [Pseudomonadota bacterium]